MPFSESKRLTTKGAKQMMAAAVGRAEQSSASVF
jgi:hypothetical protein